MKRFRYLTLAALVAFAACDEGEDTVVAPPVTGTVSGVVTVEGVGASGVTVTLSSGTTATTDGSGAYSFSGVTAGAYTVSISGFASDATFSSSAKAVTISSAGQVATANFDGSYVRTSAILGSVAAGGMGLANVSISLSGMSSASTTTDSNGQFSFSGLRAGSYSVGMTNPDAAMYSFTMSSMDVTVGAGASEVVAFSGSLLATATVSGRMFLDENDKDDTFSAGLEENLSVANVTVTIEGGAVNNTWTTQTAADGTYSFPDLEAGTYRVTLSTTDTDLPPMVTYGGTNPQLVVVTVGATGTVNFPFDITTQTIKVGGFLGTDNDVATTPGPMQAPITGWTINLYDTQANAAAGGATGRLGSVATAADGYATFRFTRAADGSPLAGTDNDRVVFAQVAAAPSATHAISGETIIEITYETTDSMTTGGDEFDALYNALTVKLHAAEIDGDTLAGWQSIYRARVDSTISAAVPGTLGGLSNANGDAIFNITTASLAASTDGTDGVFPDTLWFKLTAAQTGNNGHAWTQTPAPMDGTAVGGFLRYIWNGTRNAGDTVHLGAQEVKYLDSDVMVAVHHERDDSTTVPTYTAGDDLGNVVNTTRVQMFTTQATPVARSGVVTPGAFGGVTFLNRPTDSTFTVRARSIDANVNVLTDSMVTVMLDGSDQVYIDSTLAGSAGASSFAIKTNNNTVNGTILARDGAPVGSVIVTLTPSADIIQGSATMLDTTSAAGAYAFTGVIEGPYTVSVADVAGTWSFIDSIGLVAQAPSANVSGSANNTDAMMGNRDVQGYGVTQVANFEPRAMDTEIHGVVVNDRDSDFNTLDPDEALSGVTVNLIHDIDGDAVVDAGDTVVVATTTTDATGAYSFTGLQQDDYHVTAVSPTNATVLRALSATGAVTNTASVSTEAFTGAAAPTGFCALADCTNQNNTDQVGAVSPPAQNDEFPRWNYLTGAAAADGGALAGGGPNFNNGALTTAPTNFVHLFTTGTVVGSVTENVGTAGPVAGARVTITRCQTAAAAPSPPAAGACTAKHGLPSPHIMNVDTDASGNYTFSGLLEGVYQVDVAPATAGFTNIVTPGAGSYLATLQGNNDIETVAAFVIN